MTLLPSDLRDAIAAPDTVGTIRGGVVTNIDADGSVTVDLGAGPIPGALVLGWYTPVAGDVVQVLRRDPSSWLVLGPARTTNATTQSIVRSFGVPWNVWAAPSGGGTAGTLTVAATSTGSYRSADGWSQTAPYQGAYSVSRGLYTGCYFYGSPFASLTGRTGTSLTIRLHRHIGAGTGGVGAGGPVTQYLALHGHTSQPGGAPTLVTGTVAAGTLSDASPTTTFTLPTSWAQALIDGTAKGVAHYSGSAGDYSRCQSVAEDSLTGQLALGWST